MLVWSVLITVLHWRFPKWELWISALPLSVAGVALGTLLAFRNSATYDRYWEARTLWGRLVNASRTFARQLVVFFHHMPAETGPAAGQVSGLCRAREQYIQEMTYRVMAFAHALRHHLRREDAELELRDLLPPWEVTQLRQMSNVPAGVVMLLGSGLAQARREGWADTIALAALDETLTEFAAIQGGCERIRNTPLPPVYTQIGHKVVLLYCALLPFGMVTEVQLLTPVVVVVIAFAILSLSRITLLLENPFGLRANDLPLTALCRTIEIDLRQALAEVNVPPPVEPTHGILL
jgi:putative membrane protein